MPTPRRSTIQAEAILKKEGSCAAPVGRVPNIVREDLGGREGDKLIFERGSTWAAERAAARGTYYIVRLERAPSAAVTATEQTEAADEETHLEPFATAVERRLHAEA